MYSVVKVKILKSFYLCLSIIFLTYWKNTPTKYILEDFVVVRFVEKKILDILKRLQTLYDKWLWRNFENTRYTLKIPFLKT